MYQTARKTTQCRCIIQVLFLLFFPCVLVSAAPEAKIYFVASDVQRKLGLGDWMTISVTSDCLSTLPVVVVYFADFFYLFC